MQVPLSPLRFLERSAKFYPEQTALICGDETVSYSEFLEGVNRATNLFTDLIRPEGRAGKSEKSSPRVVFITWNCHQVIEACYATLKAPIIRVPLNVRLTPKEWEFMINDVGATAVVIDEDFVEQFNTIKPDLSTVNHFFILRNRLDSNIPKGYQDYAKAVGGHAPHMKPDALPLRGEDEPVEIFFTSGTTGRPKGVLMSSRNLYMNAVNFFLPLQISPDEVFLHSLSLFHINGWGALHFMTACSGKQVIMRRFKPEQFCILVQAHKVTLTCMVPTMMNMLVNFPDLDEFDLSSLRLIISGGAKLPIALGREVMTKLDCDIMGSYGLTETSPVVTVADILDRKGEGLSARGEDYYKRKFCPGIETLDCELKVLDESGREVPRDGKTMGEIHVRGNVITNGYWGDITDEPEAFTPEPIPWFRTGDLAVIDPDGFVHIVDRKRDIIICGGENVSSLELEDVIRTHPAVSEVAVISVSDEKWGEASLAVVVTRAGEELSEGKLLEFCREHMAKFKVPAGVRFVDELPKSGTGKILKRELRKQLDIE
jgi:fatty-acyl-CoA synthase